MRGYKWGGDIQTGTKERGARRSGGAKLRRTVLGTCCLRLKIGPVVTGMVMRSQQSAPASNDVVKDDLEHSTSTSRNSQTDGQASHKRYRTESGFDSLPTPPADEPVKPSPCPVASSSKPQLAPQPAPNRITLSAGGRTSAATSNAGGNSRPKATIPAWGHGARRERPGVGDSVNADSGSAGADAHE